MDEHFVNYTQLFAKNVKDLADQIGDESNSFVRTSAKWLGYELDDEQFIDGQGDKGLDFWFSSNDVFDLFQVKSHDQVDSELNLEPFGRDGVADIKRIIELLKMEVAPETSSKKLQDFFKVWRMRTSTRRGTNEPEPIRANVYLIVISEGLTVPAMEEFVKLQSGENSFFMENLKIEVNIHLVTIRTLVEARWREVNQEWRDSSGHKRNTIDLTPEMSGSGDALWIPGHNSAVFYTKALDLVHAMSEFGYQIFEPNVRAHIGKSTVNAAIRKSLSQSKSRKDFRFLNNGVTLVCKSFSKPTDNRHHFTVVEPGIINGLQTVVSLHDAYLELSNSEQKHFEEHCYVLIRVLTENAVPDISKVVIATNTQNPMQARNLKSNNEEQVLYEKLFAELGWFYERKQGSWDAYSGDPQRWRSLSKFKKSDFAFGELGTVGRKKYRRIDNEDLAQAWLAFIGLSDEAVHRKREIFENEDLYQLTFLLRAKSHSYLSDSSRFDLRDLKSSSTAEAPDPQLLLVAYLAQQFASIVPVSSRQAREDAIDRLRLNRNDPKENIDVKLIEDAEYNRARVVNGMSYLFVEIFGFVLFKSLSGKVSPLAARILKTRSFSELVRLGDLPAIDPIRKGEFGPDDIVALVYHAFVHVIDQLLGGAWKESYLSASPKSRFNYSKSTRERFAKQFDELDSFMTRTQLTVPWATHIPAKTGLYRYIREQLTVI